MPAIMAVFVVLASAGFGLLTYLVVAGADPVRQRALSNLRQGLAPQDRGDVAPRRLSGDGQGRAGVALLPKGELRLLDRLLSEAGRPASWPLDRVVSVKIWATVVAALLAVLLFLRNPAGNTFVLGIVLVVLVYAIPELRLWSIGIERRESMGNELADILDQMSIAVEAGLGFEVALVRVATNSDSVLAGELRRTAQDMQVGQPRRDAYLALAARTKVPALRRFIRTIIQAEESGLALRDVLRTQADEMRLIRRQRAEERAQRIPVKVIFPLTFCILPVLFIVILGPAVLNIMAAFS